jgi:hypothetical protein
LTGSEHGAGRIICGRWRKRAGNDGAPDERRQRGVLGVGEVVGMARRGYFMGLWRAVPALIVGLWRTVLFPGSMNAARKAFSTRPL